MSDMRYSAEYFQDIHESFPAVAEDFDKLAQDIADAGPLDRRTQLFTKLGVAIGVGIAGDIQNLTMQALDEGVSPEELRHAVLLSITTAGFPKMIVAMQWVREIIASKGKAPSLAQS